MQVAESLMKYWKDEILIGDEGIVVAKSDSDYPQWAFDDQIFLATLEDAQRTAVACN